MVDPASIAEYPAKLRSNLTKVFAEIAGDNQKHYIKCLVEPFHPDSAGARVPETLPRKTVTYNGFSQLDYANGDWITISNLELPCQAHTYTLPYSATLANSTPIATSVAKPLDGDANISCHYIDTGYTFNQLKNFMVVARDPTPKDLYTKLRVVGSGLRYFKTSKSENEAGTLDMYYSRNGAAIDETSTINSLFTRPTDSNCKLHLAGATGSIRGTNGFLVQSNFRPYDEHSYDLRDPVASNKALFDDDIDAVWFINMADKTLFPGSMISSLTSDAQIGIVVESLQQRHTVMARITGRTDGLALTHERIIHYEGMPEYNKIGFLSAETSPLRTVTSPLQLIQTIPTRGIFANYANKR